MVDKAKGTTFAVRKAKKGKVEGETFWADVGTLIVRDGGKTGVLFINHLDGEFAVFAKEETKPREASAA